VNGREVGVLEQADQVRLGRFLQRTHDAVFNFRIQKVIDYESPDRCW